MVPPNDRIPWERLAAYLAGGLPPEDAAEVAAWVAEDPARQALLASLREVWAVTAPNRPPLDPEQALQAIKARDAESVRVLPLRPRPRFEGLPQRRHSWRQGLVAAAIAVLAVGGWWVVDGRSRGTAEHASSRQSLTEFRTTRGQRLALTLPDGSSVVLGPESELRYGPTYGRGERTVELEGEGYFDVVHDEARPFLVHAGNAVARDLGTRFVVRAREGDDAVDVAVTEGQVALAPAAPSGGSAQPGVILDPGDLGRVTAAGHTSARRDVDLSRYVAWTDGRLVFASTPLAVVAEELGRWYDVEIELVGKGLAERRLTASFDQEPVTRVLPMIQASLGLRLTRDGRRFVLSPR